MGENDGSISTYQFLLGAQAASEMPENEKARLDLVGRNESDRKLGNADGWEGNRESEWSGCLGEGEVRGGSEQWNEKEKATRGSDLG
jgi:hypothetical protein